MPQFSQREVTFPIKSLTKAMRVVQSKMRTEATGFHKVAENVSSRYPQVYQCVCAGVYTDVIVCGFALRY